MQWKLVVVSLTQRFNIVVNDFGSVGTRYSSLQLCVLVLSEIQYNKDNISGQFLGCFQLVSDLLRPIRNVTQLYISIDINKDKYQEVKNFNLVTLF